MSSLDSLHRSATSDRRPSMASYIQTTAYEAADALTTLATLGKGQQYAPALTRELPSPTAFSHALRRTTTIASHHAPVEPSPPLDEPQTHAPTLDHYHHDPQSPQERARRQTLMSRHSPAPILAPIHNLSPALVPQTIHNLPPPPHAPHAPHAQMQQGGSPRAMVPEPDQPVMDPTAHDHTPSQTRIKHEPSGSPRESTPTDTTAPLHGHISTTPETADAQTPRAIELAKHSDMGLRTTRTNSISESLASPIDSRPPSKKRPAPSSTAAAKKKGTAKASKPSKKRKIDAEDAANTRSVTPTSRSKPATSKHGKNPSQAATPTLESSPAPDHSSQAHASDEDGDSSDDHNLYCLCRKPDNHKWMIGCDGGCDDWFHGDCVNMKLADEGLVDRFICPGCEDKGRGHTTWKPMCRREGCRKPARAGKVRESKYCSDDCGVLFMAEQLERTAGAKESKDNSRRRKRTSDMEAGEEEPTPLGGVLRAKDLKALVNASPTIHAFKNLGNGILSPPQTASPTRATFHGLPNSENLALTAGETERLTALHKEKSQLQDRLEVLKDREKFVSMVKEQAARVAEREKSKPKDFCGYDARLSWSDAEFLVWRNSTDGAAAFTFSTLAPTPEQGASLSTAAPDERDTLCLRKRCPKHPQWQKLNLQDARFEEIEVAEAMRECEKEEKSVCERARRRGAMAGLAREVLGEGRVERNREGWCEVVGS